MKSQVLREYQIQCLDAIWASHEAGQNRLLVQAATGSGKSSIFSALPQRMKAWLETFPVGTRKMLIIAHREELIDQAAARIQLFNPGLMVSVEQGDRHSNRFSDVVVASIQTLTALKCRRLKRLLTQHTFRLVVYDECHHISSTTARTALVHLGFLPPADASDTESLDAPTYDDIAQMTAALEGWDAAAPKDRLLVGFTATPNRSDGVGLGAVFQDIVFRYPLRAAIDDKWLVPIVPWVVESKINLDDVRVSHGDFNQKDLAKAVNTANRNQLAVSAWHEYAKDLQTIAFTVDVAHAHSLAEAFEGFGVRARAVSGETPKDERRDILRAYTSGDITVIANCQVFTEGTDLPNTACIVMAKPTKSAMLLEQCIGRGLRLFPAKDQCIVIDVVDVARRHSLQTAPVLYGLPPGLAVKGKRLDAIEDEWEAFKEKYPGFDVDAAMLNGLQTLDQLHARASTFDVWKVMALGAFGNGRALNWIKTAEDVYRLQYPWDGGTEILQVSPDMLGHYEVVCTLRPREGGLVRQRTLATNLEKADDGAAIAEAYVLKERQSVRRLKDVDAPWRHAPASEAQLRALKNMHVPHTPKGLTKGQASNLLDLAQARRAR